MQTITALFLTLSGATAALSRGYRFQERPFGRGWGRYRARAKRSSDRDLSFRPAPARECQVVRQREAGTLLFETCGLAKEFN